MTRHQVIAEAQKGPRQEFQKEGGKRKHRHLACLEKARLIANQITVRLANGFDTGNEATKRNLEMLSHCENLAAGFGVSLTAAMDEWVSARRAAGEIPIANAVRFYAANRADLVAIRTTAQVADEFIASRQSRGVSDAYVRSARHNLKKFTDRLKGNITDIAVGDINRFVSTADSRVNRNRMRGLCKNWNWRSFAYVRGFSL